MQEYGWLYWDDFREMVDVITQKPNTRKMRLAACAFVRRAEWMIEDPRIRDAVDSAEDFADFRVSKEHLKRVRRTLAAIGEEARQVFMMDKQKLLDWGFDSENAEWQLTHETDQLPIVQAVQSVEALLQFRDFDREALFLMSYRAGFETPNRWRSDELAQCQLLRDIFGNPFRSIPFDLSWRTETAVLIAQGMYDSRDCSAMPILADSLQDAGCENDDILNHCRGPGPHVRGCWVVDMVLGRE